MKQILSILLLSMMIVSQSFAQQQKGFRVKGKLEGLGGATLMYSGMDSNKPQKPVVLDSEGRFEFSDVLPKNGVAKLSIMDFMQFTTLKEGGKMGAEMQFFAANGDNISISGSKEEFEWAVVSGNGMNEQLNRYLSAAKPIQLQTKKVLKQYGDLKKKKRLAGASPEVIDADPAIAALWKEAEGLMVKNDVFVKNYIAEHPTEEYSALLLGSISYKMELDEIRRFYAGFDKKVQQSPFADPLAEVLSIKKAAAETGVGKPAPIFVKTDKNGKVIKLSDYRGKYVMLDFWGSWCVPCRASHPHLKKLYEKYKGKGLVVIGIAEERSSKKAAWLKAIEEDGLPWTQIMNDENKAKMDVTKMYGITGFPTKVIIDKQGKVIARFVGAEGTVPDGVAIKGVATAPTSRGIPKHVLENTPTARLDKLLKEIFGS